jgi:hypothetical protein
MNIAGREHCRELQGVNIAGGERFRYIRSLSPIATAAPGRALPAGFWISGYDPPGKGEEDGGEKEGTFCLGAPIAGKLQVAACGLGGRMTKE